MCKCIVVQLLYKIKNIYVASSYSLVDEQQFIKMNLIRVCLVPLPEENIHERNEACETYSKNLFCIDI